MNTVKLLDGYKTALAGIGLIGLGIWQISEGQVELGIQSVMAGVAALGLRHALQKKREEQA